MERSPRIHPFALDLVLATLQIFALVLVEEQETFVSISLNQQSHVLEFLQPIQMFAVRKVLVLILTHVCVLKKHLVQCVNTSHFIGLVDRDLGQPSLSGLLKLITFQLQLQEHLAHKILSFWMLWVLGKSVLISITLNLVLLLLEMVLVHQDPLSSFKRIIISAEM